MKSKKVKPHPRDSGSSATPTQDRKSEIANSKSEIVLLAVTGMSPAVLTETVWALAQERPPIIPNRVVVLTTLAGRNAIERELLTPMEPDNQTVWQRLRTTVLGKLAHDDSRLILEPPGVIAAPNRSAGRSDPLEDIRLREDNSTADFILEEVHVLVNEPFADSRLEPRFYFPPGEPVTHFLPSTGHREPRQISRLAGRNDGSVLRQS